MRALRDLRVLITGASSGIGRCLAEQAAAAGARVVLAARSAEKLTALADRLTEQGGRAVAVAADITVDEDRQRIVLAAVDHFGGLDAIINNAGVASFGHFIGGREAILRQVMEVNFFAPAELIRVALPVLRKGRQPVVLNIASMCGRRGLPAWSEYSASKFALVGLTESLRAEFVRYGIDVLLVLPGLTNTSLSQHLLRNEGKMKIDYSAGMSPDAVARSVLDVLERNRNETVLGREAQWMLRMNRFLPGLLNRLLVRKVGKLYAHS